MKILMTWHWRTVTRMFENIVRIYKRITYPFKRVLSMAKLILTAGLAYPVSWASLCHLLMALHCCLCLK